MMQEVKVLPTLLYSNLTSLTLSLSLSRPLPIALHSTPLHCTPLHVIQTHPLQLMSILDTNEHSDIISWLPHGRGFIIRDKRRLADEVLPKYFKESKYTSFTRRLNRWNFTIQTHGHKEASYFHPMFIRGEPQRSLEMHPTPQSSNKARESRYIDDNKNIVMDLMNPSGHGGSKGVGSNASMAMPGFDVGSGMRPGASYPSSVANAMVRADVSAQVMAAGAAAGGEHYMDSRSNASMPALPQNPAHMALNMPGANAQLPQVQAVSMQPQYYGQVGVPGMNPMYGTQANQLSNLTRDMMFTRLPMDRSAMSREYQNPQNMMMMHPQLGAPAAVMHPHAHPHQMPYAEYPQHQHQHQYIPTTAASHAHFQARFGDAQAQMQQLRTTHPQIQFANTPFAAAAATSFAPMNATSTPTSAQVRNKTQEAAAAADGKEPGTVTESGSDDKKDGKEDDKKEDSAKTGDKKPESTTEDDSKRIKEHAKPEPATNTKPEGETKTLEGDSKGKNEESMDDSGEKDSPTEKQEKVESKAKEGTSVKKHSSPEPQPESEPLAKKVKAENKSEEERDL
jgi:hypothetical protein